MDSRVRLILLLLLLSPDITGADVTRQPLSQALSLDQCSTDTVVTSAVIAVLVAILLLSVFTILGLVAAHRAVRGVDVEEFERNYPIFVFIVIVCIILREIAFQFCTWLPLIGTVPDRTSIRAYAVSVLIHSIPVSLFIAYKIYPLASYWKYVYSHIKIVISASYDTYKLVFISFCTMMEFYNIFFGPFQEETDVFSCIAFVIFLFVSVEVIRHHHEMTHEQKDLFVLVMSIVTCQAAKEALRQAEAINPFPYEFRLVLLAHIVFSAIISRIVVKNRTAIMIVFKRAAPFLYKMAQTIVISLDVLLSNLFSEFLKQNFIFMTTIVPDVPHALKLFQIFVVLIVSIFACEDLYCCNRFQTSFLKCLALVFAVNTIIVLGAPFI